MSQVSTSSSLGQPEARVYNDWKSYVNEYNLMERNPMKINYWRCVIEGCGDEFKYAGGWTSMGKHLLNCHRDILMDCIERKSKMKKRPIVEEGQTQLDKFYSYVSPKARLYSDWLQLILFENLVLDSCDATRHPVLAKYITLDSMSRNTLRKYLLLLGKYVQDKVKKILPPRFILMFDGWSIGTEHYLGVFAVFTDKDTKKKRRLLLGCMVADDLDEDIIYTADVEESEKYFGLTSEDMYDQILDILRDLGFSENELNEIQNIVQCLIGDSVAANLKLARNLNIPFVRCRSHLLNLATNAGLGNPQRELKKKKRIGVLSSSSVEADADIEDDDGVIVETDYDDPQMMRRELILKEDKLQGCLITVKNASTLRSNNVDVAPERMNKTRWSSIYNLNRRTLDMYEKKDLAMINFDVKSRLKLSKYLLSYEDLRNARLLDTQLSKIEIGTKELQKDDMTLEKCQSTIAFLYSRVPDILSYSEHLKNDYLKDELDIDERGRKLYTSFHFNNGVIKIQRGMESQLTLPEKRACACLKKESEDDLLESQSSESDDDETQREKKRFARELHDGQHQATSSKKFISEYEADHVEGTSDPVERLFSFCKRVMTDLRKHMGPEILNSICCLTVNRSLWAANENMPARILHDIIQAEEKRKQEDQERRRKEEQDVRDDAWSDINEDI